MQKMQTERPPENVYYGTTLLVRGVPLFLAWVDVDTGRILTKGGSLWIFDSMEKRGELLQKQGMRREDDESVYDIDGVADWLKNPSDTVPANELNLFWNLCDDIARSTHRYFYGNQRTRTIDAVYDKLFFACNLPAIRGDGEEYVPVWRKQERKLLRQVIYSGLSLLQKELEKTRRQRNSRDGREGERG